jgi:hypothetical protein
MRLSDLPALLLSALRARRSLLRALLLALVLASPAPAQETAPGFRRVEGMLMLDYSAFTLRNGADFDLLGIHYLQRLNDWLSMGVGAFAPVARGNYGGFYGADATLHVQRRVAGNWFVNGGLSFGAAAGGASVVGIQRFSGEGFYTRAYLGIGYATRRFSFGVNYANIRVAGSPINSNTVNFFVQRPLSFSVASYDDAGRVLGADEFASPEQENMLSAEVSNVRQISPTGLYRGDIGLASTQFTHFLGPRLYGFFGIDIGVSGLQWFNQAQGGFGARVALGPRWNLYGQIGLGSGGWVPSHIDTGPGFVIFPKVMLEYLWGNGVGTTLSAGYLYAPLGTSRNWTVGLGMTYHLSYARRAPDAGDYTLRGIRLNVFGRQTSGIFYNGRETDGISMIAVQADYALNRHWYLAGQVAAAVTAFRNYAGYAEGFVGLGWQSSAFAGGRLQGYAQLMLGLNDVGVDPAHEVGALLYPSFGLTYRLNDRMALYSQIGGTMSLGQYLSANPNRWETYSVGLGVTYRFSLPTRS